MRAPVSILERIERRVDRGGGPEACHPWLGGANKWGSPRFCVTKGKGGNPRAYGWEGLHGPVPAGKVVTTTCSNPRCMNPEHWELRAYGDDVARFWENVAKAPGDACWVWTASVQQDSGGYAQMKRLGKKIRASRFAWEMANGPIEDPALFVCHHCDNPKCVRPSHLFLGTPGDNHRDMWAKGRGSKGAAHAAKIRAARERICPTSAKSEP